MIHWALLVSSHSLSNKRGERKTYGELRPYPSVDGGI
jgi:hypothetical protein